MLFNGHTPYGILGNAARESFEQVPVAYTTF